MKAHPDRKFNAQAIAALSQALEIPEKLINSRHSDPWLFQAEDWTFAARWTSYGTVGPTMAAAEVARLRAGEAGPKATPLVVAPFIGPSARERLKAAGVAWLDLSGNAGIIAPGLRVFTAGHPNRFKRAGRPSSPFAPKGARIARWLLMQPGRSWSQYELARAAGIDEGYASRVVAKLVQDKLIDRLDDGKVQVRNPGLLLDAWREEHRFDKHDIIRGHIAARSGDELLHELAKALKRAGVDYAATGLAAAWLLTSFAGFQLASVYLASYPTDAQLSALSFRREERGANVWLIVPKDEGVFHGTAAVNGVSCVHPVQALLDLDHHPERSKEAAAELRRQLLKGSA